MGQTGRVVRRWRKERKERDGDPDPSDDDAADASPPTDDDLEARLAAVTSRFDRPPTPEELRAAFRRRHDEPDEPAPAADFTSRFTTESLFATTPVQDHVEPGLDDRSRTKGDYYYDPEDAWAVLGLPSGASWKEIAAAHRRLAMEHHPDRLLDASPDERAASEEAMREINVAYSVLRRLTGH